MANEQPTKSALAVVQQIIILLSQRIELTFPHSPSQHPTVDRAKELVNWNDNAQIDSLRSIFDRVALGSPNRVTLDQPRSSDSKYYFPLQAIADEEPDIPYPSTTKPNFDSYQETLKTAIESITLADWENLSFLTIFLEKYASCLSIGEEDIALNDFARSTAAIASALAQAEVAGLDIENTQLRLIAGDLSGIQKFIYTISSDGALKSLRARSFFLELVTTEIAYQLIEELHINQTNIIYAGGGNVYILAAATEDGERIIQRIRDRINDWFIDEFQGELFLALDWQDFPQADIKSKEFALRWANVTQNLGIQKGRKFAKESQLKTLLRVNPSHEPCKVCHRDDEEKLGDLHPDSTVQACGTCRRMYRLGSQIFRTRLVVRSRRLGISQKFIKVGLGKDEVFYYLCGDDRSQTSDIDRFILDAETDPVWLINNWKIEHYRSPNTRLLLLGNYGQRRDDDSTFDEDEKAQYGRFIRAEELAEIADGIDRVGYLRMDVDNLGSIFARGLGDAHNLTRLAGLSRQMSYFFKVYLNNLAAKRQQNSPANFTQLTDTAREDLLFIYAGGDDLFISGAWNQIAEFAQHLNKR